jgi:hypothetical protein
MPVGGATEEEAGDLGGDMGSNMEGLEAEDNFYPGLPAGQITVSLFKFAMTPEGGLNSPSGLKPMSYAHDGLKVGGLILISFKCFPVAGYSEASFSSSVAHFNIIKYFTGGRCPLSNRSLVSLSKYSCTHVV